MTERGLVFTDEQEVSVEPVDRPDPDDGEVVVDTEVSAISPGTELLIYRGDAPSDIDADTALQTLDGTLSYPLQYGYSAAGEVVETGPGVESEWLGREVVAFHPHQTTFATPTDCLITLPPEIDPDAGTLFPSVETATNLALDGDPKLGGRVVVFGAGVIGLCTTHLLAEYPLDSLVVVEPIPSRRSRARAFGADEAIPPAEATDLFEDGADLVYELSGQPDVLDDALDVVGFDGRIVVGSWYGDKRSPLDLGRSFHRDRIEIVSSQVSTIDPDLRGRWSKRRRTSVALERLQTLDHDRLITDIVPFERAAEAYERLQTEPADTLQVLLTYE